MGRATEREGLKLEELPGKLEVTNFKVAGGR